MGHWRLFFVFFKISHRPFFNIFPFPSCTDKLLGDFHILAIRTEQVQPSFNAPIQMAHRFPCAINNSAPNKTKNPRNIIWKLKAHRVQSASPNGAGGIGVPIYCLSLYLHLPSDFPLSHLPHHLHLPRHLRLPHHLYLLYIHISCLIQNGKAHLTVRCTSHIGMDWTPLTNLFVLCGNGNTPKKRRREN